MRNFLMAMDADKILFPKYFALCPRWLDTLWIFPKGSDSSREEFCNLGEGMKLFPVEDFC